jgi:hypothetical protein
MYIISYEQAYEDERWGVVVNWELDELLPHHLY